MREDIIVIGAPRSGTNMLRDFLTGLPRVGTWPCDEINHVWRYGVESTRTDELDATEARRATRGAVNRAFAWVRRKYGTPFVVEKTCANSLRVGYVESLRPDSRYVYIYRNGFDASLSASKVWNAPRSLMYSLAKYRFVPLRSKAPVAAEYIMESVRRSRSQARGENPVNTWGPRFEGLDEMLLTKVPLVAVSAEQWRRCAYRSVMDLGKLPKSRVYAISYEAVCRNPTLELGQLVEWIGTPASTKLLSALTEGISTSSIDSHRRLLSSGEVALIRSTIEQGTAEIERFVKSWGG